MRIVAFDLSLTCSGVCTGDRVTTIVPPKGIVGPERLGIIRSHVLTKANGADLVVIEGYSYGAQGAAILNIAELGGVIRWTLYDKNIPFVLIPPANLKQCATGKGNAKKDEVLAAAIRQLGYMGHSHDEADAMWLWRMAQLHYAPDAQGAIELTEYRKKALAKIEWPKLHNLPTLQSYASAL